MTEKRAEGLGWRRRRRNVIIYNSATHGILRGLVKGSVSRGSFRVGVRFFFPSPFRSPVNSTRFQRDENPNPDIVQTLFACETPAGLRGPKSCPG